MELMDGASLRGFLPEAISYTCLRLLQSYRLRNDVLSLMPTLIINVKKNLQLIPLSPQPHFNHM